MYNNVIISKRWYHYGHYNKSTRIGENEVKSRLFVQEQEMYRSLSKAPRKIFLQGRPLCIGENVFYMKYPLMNSYSKRKSPIYR